MSPVLILSREEIMNDADAARGKGAQPRDIGGHRHVPMSGKNAVNSAAKV
jgi:hypothetical protein